MWDIVVLAPLKNWLFWSNPYKIEVMITSLIEMLELPNLGHIFHIWFKFDHIHNIFFLSRFSFTTIHESQDCRGRGGIPLTPYYHFHSFYRHLDISRVITADSSPLPIGRSWTRTGTFGFWAQVINQLIINYDVITFISKFSYFKKT